LSYYCELVERPVSDSEVSEARKAVTTALEYFHNVCDEETEWGSPFDEEAADVEDIVSGGMRSGPTLRMTVDYSVSVRRKNAMVRKAKLLAEADDACMPMQVSGVADAAFVLLATWNRDIVERFHEVGVAVEFTLRDRSA
jgi:hypothetical protein